MRKAVRTICLTFVLTVAMLLLGGPSCDAAKVDVLIHLDRGVPEIYVQDIGKKFVGLCRNKTINNPPSAKLSCEANDITWRLVGAGPLNADEEVRIVNAPGYTPCFGPDPVVVFDGTMSPPLELSSGPSTLACTQKKYGTFWPYVVEYWVGGVLAATTDPGAIIFP